VQTFRQRMAIPRCETDSVHRTEQHVSRCHHTTVDLVTFLVPSQI
jgi:hypothetical protein